MLTRHVLVVRFDNLGDVLLSGPLVRSAATVASKVTYLCSPRGEAVAQLLPGVDEVMVAQAGWIEAPAPRVSRRGVVALSDRIAGAQVDEAVILTSFHQSPLPTALVARMAGVARIGAISVDYPGSLLDVRHHVSEATHEVERSLSLGRSMGYDLPAGDDGALRIRPPGVSGPAVLAGRRYVVVHPGASVTARAADPDRLNQVVTALAQTGRLVAVTGSHQEKSLTSRVAGDAGIDLGGGGDLAALAAVVAAADAIVVGNTGPAHLAAAVGTPVVSLFAPTVPAPRWRPWMVPHVLLGDQTISCAGCRALECPVPGHPCVDGITAAQVVDAVEALTGSSEADARAVAAAR